MQAEAIHWHQENWHLLQSRRAQSQLAHGMLLAGPEGIGKLAFSLAFARSILCESPDPDSGQACGSCSACIRFDAQTHPDLHMLEPEEPGKAIKVDQVRELIESLSLSSHYQGYKVGIICPADAMNINAANSLLKTLEEPPANTLIMLITSKPGALPATIRSRCQALSFRAPSREQGIEWLVQAMNGEVEPSAADEILELTHNAPMTALSWFEQGMLEVRDRLWKDFVALANHTAEPVSIAEQWVKLAQLMPIYWLQSWTADLIKLKSTGKESIQNKSLEKDLHKLSQVVNLADCYEFLDACNQAKRLQETSVNAQMVLEGLLLKWAYIPRAVA